MQVAVDLPAGLSQGIGADRFYQVVHVFVSSGKQRFRLNQLIDKSQLIRLVGGEHTTGQ